MAISTQHICQSYLLPTFPPRRCNGMEVRSKTQNLSTMDKYETMSGLVENFLGGWLVGWLVGCHCHKAEEVVVWQYSALLVSYKVFHLQYPWNIYAKHLFLVGFSSSRVELQVINCIPAAPVQGQQWAAICHPGTAIYHIIALPRDLSYFPFQLTLQRQIFL